MLLGIICNTKDDDIGRLQAVNHMYLTAVATHMNVQPVLIPANMDESAPDIELLLDRLDGVLLTGNRSNIHPSHYGVAADAAYEPYDQARDAAALALAKVALERDIAAAGHLPRLSGIKRRLRRQFDDRHSFAGRTTAASDARQRRQ